jgi:hypothetical protein
MGVGSGRRNGATVSSEPLGPSTAAPAGKAGKAKNSLHFCSSHPTRLKEITPLQQDHAFSTPQGLSTAF